MSNSYPSEIPKARINLQLLLHTGGAAKKTELPLKLLVTGDFSNGQEQRPLSKREKININKNNFNSVLVAVAPSVNLSVKNTLKADGSEDNVSLRRYERLRTGEGSPPDPTAESHARHA